MATVIFITILLELCLSALGIFTYFISQKLDEKDTDINNKKFFQILAISFITCNIISIISAIFGSYTRNLYSWILSSGSLITVTLLWILAIIRSILCVIDDDIDETQKNQYIIFAVLAIIIWIFMIFSVYNLLQFIRGNHYRNFRVLHAPHLLLMIQEFTFSFTTILAITSWDENFLDDRHKMEFWAIPCMLLVIGFSGIGMIIGILALLTCHGARLMLKIFGIISIIVCQFVIYLLGMMIWVLMMVHSDAEEYVVRISMGSVFGLVIVLICISCYKLQRYLNKKYNDNNDMRNYGLSFSFLLWPFTVFYLIFYKKKRIKAKESVNDMLNVSIFVGVVCYLIVGLLLFS